MANVLYIVCWEGLRRHGLMENQVYRLLMEIRRSSDHQITLLSAAPFWRGRLLRWLQRRFSFIPGLARRQDTYTDPAELRAQLRAHGADLVFRNLWWSPPSVYLPWWRTLTFPLAHVWFLHRLIRRHRIDIVHGRSYNPTWLAWLSRRLFKGRHRIIFDTRGLLPEEGVATGYLREGGPSYRVWKAIERRLARDADAVVNVTDTFTDYLEGETGRKDMRTITLSVDLAAFRLLPAGAPAGSREERVLVYLGSISRNGWHSLEYLARLYTLFRERFEKARLLLITPSGHDVLRQDLRDEGVPEDELRLTAARSLDEVAAYLAQAAYGALPYRSIRHECDRRIGYTMMASKLGEYLAAGLPVLCNRNIGGAKRVIEEHGVGALVDLEQPGLVDPMAWPDPTLNPDLAGRCRKAAERFSIESRARAYADLYGEMSGA